MSKLFNTSTFSGLHGDMVDQVMGCSDGLEAYNAKREKEWKEFRERLAKQEAEKSNFKSKKK